jgi:hypothetical protein
MEAECSSETPVNLYQTTRHHSQKIAFFTPGYFMNKVMNFLVQLGGATEGRFHSKYVVKHFDIL